MNKIYPTIFILLTLVLAGREAGARPAAQAVTVWPAVGTYDELVTAIREAKAQSRERVEALVEAEKVHEAWEIGKLIETHILQHKPRANYDEQVIERLSKDLDSSPTEIWYMLEFARAYPIVRPAGQLSWSHYQALLSLNNPQEREEVAKQAITQGWTRDQVREEVRRRQASRRPAEQREPAQMILTVTSGKPGMYRVVKAYYGNEPNQLVLDLGFSSYLNLEEFSPATAFQEGDIVRENKGRLEKSNDADEKDLFTYPASVVGVIDGDTLTAAVDLGFGVTTVQTLRLRALDAPEIETAAGREAKEFLEKILPQGSSVLIRTHRSDKYDRYLADIFVNGEHVNQKLVDEGFAIPLGNWVEE